MAVLLHPPPLEPWPELLLPRAVELELLVLQLPLAGKEVALVPQATLQDERGELGLQEAPSQLQPGEEVVAEDPQ